MAKKEQKPDGRPTTAEWPVKIWEIHEIPPEFARQAEEWMEGDFSEYSFVYAPKRRTKSDSFAYLFGYGKDKVLYLREKLQDSENPSDTAVEMINFDRAAITKVRTTRELLDAKILVYYRGEKDQKMLEFPYVPSVYYLYDPFLNWILGIAKDFSPALAEREHPRPEKLYYESLVMFNYALAAYRLGEIFGEYSCRSEIHRHKWMPWKKTLEEWMEVSMERGKFELHSIGYLTECTYHVAGKMEEV